MRCVKFIWKTTVLCLSAATVLLGSAQAAEKEAPEDARTYLKSAYENTMRLESFHESLAIDLETPFADVRAKVTGDLLLNPALLGKITTKAVVQAVGYGETKLTITQYVQQQGVSLLLFLKTEEEQGKRRDLYGSLAAKEKLEKKPAQSQWFKRVFPPEEKKDLVRIEDLDAVMAYVKDVKFTDRAGAADVMEVTLDMEKIRRDHAALYAEEDKKKSVAPRLFSLQKTVDKMLKAAGDISYTVKVDKERRCIVHVYADLTLPVQRALSVAADDDMLLDKERQLCRLLIGAVRLVVQGDFSQQNLVKPFEIPQDVTENAKEITVWQPGKRGPIPAEIESAAA